MTPIQEIYAELRASKEKDSWGEVYCVDWLLENEKSFLKKEKEMMCQFAESFVEAKCDAYIDENEPNGCALNWIQTPLDYYEETFNTKEK